MGRLNQTLHTISNKLVTEVHGIAVEQVALKTANGEYSPEAGVHAE